MVTKAPLTIINDLPEGMVSEKFSGILEGFIASMEFSQKGDFIYYATVLTKDGNTGGFGLASFSEDGKIIRKTLSTGCTSARFVNDGEFLIMEHKEGKGLFDRDGEILIPCEYEGIYFFDGKFYGIRNGDPHEPAIWDIFDRDFDSFQISEDEVPQKLKLFGVSVNQSGYYVDYSTVMDPLIQQKKEILTIIDRKNDRGNVVIDLSKAPQWMSEDPSAVEVYFGYGGFYILNNSEIGESVLVDYNGTVLDTKILTEITGIPFLNENVRFGNDNAYYFDPNRKTGEVSCVRLSLPSVFLDFRDFGNGIFKIGNTKYFSRLIDSYKYRLSTPTDRPITVSTLENLGFTEISKETDDTVEIRGKILKKNILKIK